MTKTLKKSVSLLLALVMLFAVTAVSAFAFTSEDELFDCEALDEKTAKITNYSASSKDIVVPEKVKDYKGNEYIVTAIDNKAFEKYENSLRSISIPGSVKTIPSELFQNFSALEEVTLNEGIKTIGTSAFQNCTKLKEIVIPDSVESLGARAFGECEALESVKIGKGLKEIPGTAFYGCKNLTTVYLGINTESVNDTSFRGCTSLEDIYVYDKLSEFPVESVDFEKVTFHCYPDSDFYDFCMQSDYEINVETYPVKSLTVTVDEEKQFYYADEFEKITKDGIVVEAVFEGAPNKVVTDKCTVSSEDDFTTSGEKTVTVSYLEKSATFTATVLDFSFSGKPSAVTIQYKDAYRFNFTSELPEDAKIIWKSSNPKVITVDENGNLKTLKRGTAVVSATIDGTEKTVSCTVTVKYAWWQWILIIVLFGWIWYR